MNHGTASVPVQLAIVILVAVLPALWVTVAVRRRALPTAAQFGFLFALALLAGILLSVPAISIVATVALAGLGLAWLSAHYALSGVSYRRSLEPGRLFSGDDAYLVTRLDNHKVLPLGWFRITDPISVDVLHRGRKFTDLLRFSEGVETPHSGPVLVDRGAVGPFQELVRRYPFTALQRGVYALGPARFESGDPFGIFHREGTMDDVLRIIVYPQIYRSVEIDLTFQEAIGEVRVRRALLEDPTLMAGSREYQPGDPLRRVDWKATARKGDLQVRIADPSTTAKLMIVLNLTTFHYFWEGIRSERVEEAIRVAGSLADWALERNFAVGLRSNGILARDEGDSDAPRLAPSAHPRQKLLLLEHLARLLFSGRFSAEQILLDEARRLGDGTSIAFVTTVMTPELTGVLRSRQLAGRVSVVYCGSAAAPVVRGLPIQLVAPRREAFRAIS